ncbi:MULTISPECIES: DNA polymerase III subunit delta [unclassified Psychrobacter]|uniref:DNA polymerase III subunit delta n=1 Tax=unclassified Psychrobacter TaxID=196806 RepID=UPI000ED59F2C|nr:MULTISPECIES: DNA polymerase III subunit delta [unclassified Psychrobacter]MBE8609669.1 DNA polymerase III subunit delta [Pseudomonas lundensis]HCI75568.1 DNA polymerase III subunit delta [Psychrobacter sp.]
MQDTFIQAYPKLLQPSVAVAGLWLAHGDEPLLSQWLIDALRPHWRAQNYAIKRIELISVKSWQEVLSELGSQSLFDDASALIVTGNHKPDKAVITELERFAVEAQTGTHSHSLLWLTPKQDKRAQSSKWFAPFAQYGHVIDCNLYNEQQRQQLLQIQAQQFGLRLSQEAWQLLMSHTEHHLLSAYQTLWRLSYLFAPQLVAKNIEASQQADHSTQLPNNVALDIKDLQAALVSDAQFSVFDLSDAMLAGNSTQVAKIMFQLKATDEPTTLVLWAVSKDMRQIMQLMDGQDPQSLGIWRSKQGLYQQACRRQSKTQTAEWPALLYKCDQAIKGLVRQPAWELLLQAALELSGKRLFAV